MSPAAQRVLGNVGALNNVAPPALPQAPAGLTLVALQVAVAPPSIPLQVQSQWVFDPSGVTELTVPAVQRLVVGAEVNPVPFELLQTPSTGA